MKFNFHLKFILHSILAILTLKKLKWNNYLVKYGNLYEMGVTQIIAQN